ncbi:MAG: hypothetical protein ACN6Q5_27800, partial [Pseudomonas sp.]|uniref:hypothetical protein n=1 Tax=Pseudomonas sp. TaxID=306 RepID=UPI003D144E6E
MISVIEAASILAVITGGRAMARTFQFGVTVVIGLCTPIGCIGRGLGFLQGGWRNIFQMCSSCRACEAAFGGETVVKSCDAVFQGNLACRIY